MSKKDKKDLMALDGEQPVESKEIAKTEEKKVDKKADKKAVKRAADKKPGFFARMWKKIKEVFGELKKVTWPTIPKTIQQTGIVIAVVLFFMILIGLANAGLLALYKLVLRI